MRRWQKWSLGTSTAIVGLGVGAWFAAPSFLAWEANKKPGVHVGRVEILTRDKCLILHDVDVDRTWLHGHFPEVKVCNDKHVYIDGGAVFADLDLKPEHSKEEAKEYSISAKNLSVTAVKGDVVATLERVDLVLGGVCSQTAFVAHPKGVLRAQQLCWKDGVATFVSGQAELQEPLHGHDLGVIHIGATEVQVAEKKAKVEFLEAGPMSLSGLRVSLLQDESGKLVVVDLDSATVTEAHLADTPLTFRRIQASIDPQNSLLSQFVRVSGIDFHIQWSKDRKWISAGAKCQTWYDMLPVEMKTGVLANLHFDGGLYFGLDIEPKVKLDWQVDCRSPKPAPDFIQKLSKPFHYTVYDANNKPVDRLMGPGTRDWVAFPLISHSMLDAVTTTEDPGFLEHRGFSRQAIENSIEMDLKAGKAIRGASTITMQLAKNLFLNRSKTLSRKVEEAFLTFILESYLTKAQILELYLNAVEFGPNIYGIGPAASALVHSDAGSLTLTDSLYLALRLPSPKKSGPMTPAKKEEIKRILQSMGASGKVPQILIDTEVDSIDGKDETSPP